jgi:large subunit ribosomal protein L18
VSILTKIQKRTVRRTLRTRARLDGKYPRISVFRSLSHMYVQLIDDSKQLTLASSSTLRALTKGTKTERSYAAGLELAQKALALGVTQVSFDRGRCAYHGRVKAVAEGLRAGGIHV